MSKNSRFFDNIQVMEFLPLSVDYYETIGFELPWICYVVSFKGEMVGNAAFKGKPRFGTVEIAYATFPAFRHKGIGTLIANELVRIAIAEDPTISIKARTLPERSFSTRILEKSDFALENVTEDPDDGLVWEWRYVGQKKGQ
jgi:[ribosomal protein S5]-alanine N-acetyltransferase